MNMTEDDTKLIKYDHGEREKAQTLRLQGWTCGEIGEEIGRTKETVVRMVKGIPQGERQEQTPKLPDPPTESTEMCPKEPVGGDTHGWLEDRVEFLEGAVLFLYNLLEDMDGHAIKYKYNYDAYREGIIRMLKRRKKLGIKVEGKWPNKTFDLSGLKLLNGKAMDEDED